MQQEEVEAFFHLLLAFNREEALGLGWVGLNSRSGAGAVALHALNLLRERVHHVVEALSDGLAQRNELGVEVFHIGVFHRAVGGIVVALQQQGVVFVYLALHAGIL